MFPSLKKATPEEATVADCEVKVCVKLPRFWVVFTVSEQVSPG